ncbi:MAG: nitroreductase family protein [Thermoplasmatota archaeon]
MDVKDAIEERRAYRSLEKIEIDDKIINKLGVAAQLTPSCFNNQPWNFVFVKSEERLKKLEPVMSKNNKWTNNASLIVAVFSKKDDDCVVKGREYHLFDTGMATAFLILRATELGLVAHPIAGYDEEETKELLDIPEEYRLITLVIIGKYSEESTDLLTEKQAEREKERPERKDLDELIHIDTCKEK